MEYIDKAIKKFPKEKVKFMVGGVTDALKKFSGLTVPGIPALGDLTDKVADLQNVANALQSGNPAQIASAVASSNLSTNINAIAEGAALASQVGGTLSNLDDNVKNKIDAAATLASAVSSPEKIQELAGKAQELMGMLSSLGVLSQAAQSFLGGKFVTPILKPLVGKMVDAQKVWELPSQYKAEYPHNKVTSTPSGHTIQIDDTPGEERLAVHDMRGNYIEMGKDGVQLVAMTKLNVVAKSASPGGEFSLRIKSKCDIHVDGDANIKVTGNMDSEVEGDSSVLVKGNAGIVVNKDASTLVQGDNLLQVNGIATIHSDNHMLIRTEETMTFEAHAGMDITSEADLNITAKGAMKLKAKTIDLNP